MLPVQQQDPLVFSALWGAGVGSNSCSRETLYWSCCTVALHAVQEQTADSGLLAVLRCVQLQQPHQGDAGSTAGAAAAAAAAAGAHCGSVLQPAGAAAARAAAMAAQSVQGGRFGNQQQQQYMNSSGGNVAASVLGRTGASAAPAASAAAAAAAAARGASRAQIARDGAGRRAAAAAGVQGGLLGSHQQQGLPSPGDINHFSQWSGPTGIQAVDPEAAAEEQDKMPLDMLCEAAAIEGRAAQNAAAVAEDDAELQAFLQRMKQQFTQQKQQQQLLLAQHQRQQQALQQQQPFAPQRPQPHTQQRPHGNAGRPVGMSADVMAALSGGGSQKQVRVQNVFVHRVLVSERVCDTA